MDCENSNKLHALDAYQTAALFLDEWQDLILILLILANPLDTAMRWISRKSILLHSITDLSNSRLECAPFWQRLLLDLQKEVPLIVELELVYQSKIFLLPGRAQANLLTFIYLNFDKIEKSCSNNFIYFLLRNFARLNDLGKTIIPKYLTKSNDIYSNDGISTVATKESLGNSAEAVSVIGNHEYKPFSITSMSHEPCQVFSYLKEDKIISSNPLPCTTTNTNNVLNHNNFVATTIPFSPAKDQEFSEIIENEQRSKKQKLAIDYCSFPLTNNEESNPQPVIYNANNSKSISQLPDMTEIRKLINRSTNTEAVCEILNTFNVIPYHNMDKVIDTMYLSSLTEREIVFFVNCCLCDKVVLSSSIIEQLISHSLTNFLLKIKHTISGSILNCLVENLKCSKEILIFSVILPILLTADINMYQEDLIIKILSSEPVDQVDLSEALNFYVTESRNNNVISNSALIFIKFVLEKKITLNLTLASDLVNVLEKNVTHVKDSNIFVKIVMILSTFYKKEVVLYRPRLEKLVEGSKSFLMKSALFSLQRL